VTPAINSVHLDGISDEGFASVVKCACCKENTEDLVAATMEIVLEVNTDKTKYMVMSRDQNAGRNHSINFDNISFERVEKFKYLGTN
jgi:hypothetical protein